METLFLVKRLLDRMDAIGNEYSGPGQKLRKAADEINVYHEDPAVHLAAQYIDHELRCFFQGVEPMRLAAWYLSHQKPNLKCAQ